MRFFTNYKKLYEETIVKITSMERKNKNLNKEIAILSNENNKLIAQSIKDELEKKDLEEKRRKNAASKGGLMTQYNKLLTRNSYLEDCITGYKKQISQLESTKKHHLEEIGTLVNQVNDLKNKNHVLIDDKLAMNKIIDELNKKNAMLKHPVKIEELRKYQILRKSRKKEEK